MESIEEIAARTETLLTGLCAGVMCVPQSWDDRIDCLLKLSDGRVVGEMIPLSGLTEERITATAERLSLRARGIDVPLVDEVRAGARISSA